MNSRTIDQTHTNTHIHLYNSLKRRRKELICVLYFCQVMEKNKTQKQKDNTFSYIRL